MALSGVGGLKWTWGGGVMGVVYFVTDGSYSDYRILGVYSTKKLAEHAKLLHDAANDVEEFQLDHIPDHPPGLLCWQVVMDRSGNSKVYRNGVISEERWSPYGLSSLVVFSLWARDEEHAVKIANERRIALLASGEWTTDLEAWRVRQRP